MIKKLACTLLIFAFCWESASASHVNGGMMTYQYTGGNSYAVGTNSLGCKTTPTTLL